jgi:DNA-binding transcriptional ArsR family regulator
VAEDRNRIDPQLVKALSHPIRVEILQTLQGRIASSIELFEEIDERPGVVSYHAKMLVKYGCVELIHSAPRLGAVENYFGIVD